MTLDRLLAAVALSWLVAAASAPSAVAGPILDRAAERLGSDPVYVDPAAERALSEDEADRLRGRIRRADAGPMYVAILPDAARAEAGGSADGVLDALHDGLGRDGTYVVVVGDAFRAGSTTLESGVVPRLAEEALAAHRSDGVLPTLLDFVSRVAAERGGASPADGRDEEEEGGGIPGWVLVGLGAGGVGFFLLRRRRKGQREASQVTEVKREAEADLLALADDIRALDLDVEMPGADERGRADYAAAVAAYERADRALDRARRPEDLEEVSAALEEGRYAMESAKARLAGRPVPERRPPCFFDPRHGPSVEDVEWAPAGGAPRPVPVCAADAQRIRDGLDPQAREVVVGGERVPYWQAGPAFGPYAGGFFGGVGGLLPGLLIGSMLGSGWGAGPGFGDGVGDEGGGFDDVGGGDFGGGDFGGGDFGGGDFGGGDFGGE